MAWQKVIGQSRSDCGRWLANKIEKDGSRIRWKVNHIDREVDILRKIAR